VFEAQLHLDNDDAAQAGQMAYDAMLQAAKALIQHYNIDVSEDPEAIIQDFRTRFYDTELFFDPFAGAKFAHYLFRIHEEGQADTRASVVRQRIEEAQLFIEAAHGCYNRMGPQPLQILV
jgi:sulfite reductase (ferredoxin)